MTEDDIQALIDLHGKIEVLRTVVEWPDCTMLPYKVSAAIVELLQAREECEFVYTLKPTGETNEQ